MVDPNQHDKFVLRQRVKLVINQYQFSLPEADDGEGNEQGTEPFCFVEQKRFKFKEDIRFFVDDEKTQELLRIKARQRFDPRAKYDITDPSGAKVGMMQKVFGASLFRSTYTLFDAADNELCTVREVSMPKAIFRRVVGFVPYLGDFADWLPIAYDFEFIRGDEVLGLSTRRRWKWRDVYDMDFTGDTAKVLDRRLILATAVGLDALQAR